MALMFKGAVSDIVVEFDDSVVSYLGAHTSLECEVGGQLFAQFGSSAVVIKKITQSPVLGKSKRLLFQPDRTIEQTVIYSMFKDGYHYVGDWHSHPEEIPSPSATDLVTIKSVFINSLHVLSHLLLVIVGTRSLPCGLFVGLQDKDQLEICNYMTALETGKNSDIKPDTAI